MRIDGLLNKYELFQHFYYEINGVVLSYNDAVKLFYDMDADTKDNFMQFCADKDEYEITDACFITSASGYGLDKEITVSKSGQKTRATRKSRSGEKRGEYVWSSNISNFTKDLIAQKYTAEAYAVKNGLTLDEVWSQFSAEEIMEMFNNGVSIPQEIVDAAQTELQSQTGNLEGAEGETEEGAGNDSEKTEKETFLELIPKAKKHIDKCHDKEEKIDEKVAQLIQDNGGIQKSFEEKMKKQKDTLKDYEQKIREWRELQNKINNGEELSDTEARKYAQITGMLEDKNGSFSDFKLDKLSIARNLNEINILAVLGEQLADETIEIGDQLSDYVSKTNYKSTRAQVTGEMGFLRTIIAMLNGKTLAKEANEVGHETKDYTEDTVDSIADIAGLLGVEKMIVSPSTQPDIEKPADVEDTENKVEVEGTDPQEALPSTEDEIETVEAAKNKNETAEEDFIVNDENVLALIDEASKINSDLLKQTRQAVNDIKLAKDDKEFAETALKVVTKIIENYKKEEEIRQQEIAAKEEENQKAQEKIEELGGGENEDEKIVNGMKADDIVSGEATNENQDEIDEQKAIIDQNNIDIEALNEESAVAKEEVKNATHSYKERIDKTVPDEMKVLENNNIYKDEIIPENKEELSFTLSNGKTLNKMGKYRVEIGIEQIARLQFKKGFRNVTKGTISQNIGANATLISSTPISAVAEKATENAVEIEDKAIESLTNLDNSIIGFTEEKSASESVTEDDEDNEDKNGETSNGADGTYGKDNKNGENVSGQNPIATAGKSAQQKSSAVHTSVGKTQKVQKAPKSREDMIKEAKAADKKANGNDDNSLDKLPKRNKKKDKNEGITDTDKAGNAVSDINRDAKDSARDSEKVKKDSDKDTKQLDKETKKLQKKMKKDEKDIIKMTKESIKAAKRQEEILKRYEELTKENDAIAEEEANKRANAPAQAQPQGTAVQGVLQGGMTGATNSFSLTDSSKSTSAENAKKMEDNNQEITVLSGQFTAAGNKITRNRAKIVKLQKATKKNVKTVNQKSKIKNEKIKEAEQKEMDKQKRLAKQLATVGVAENVFSTTLATGELMLLSPWTHAAGVVLVKIGTYGLIACAVAKGTINLANGNLTAALVGLGQTAVSVVGAMTGAGAGATNVLQAVSAGLSVVSSSAQLVNNVRTLQGKEADGALSMIGTIAGVASSITSAGAGLMGTKNVKTGETFGSTFSQASSLGKFAQIANIAGTAMSSTGQLMSEFGGAEGIANILSTIGGGISLAASVTQLAAKKGDMDSKNKENTEQTQQNADSQNDVTDTNTSESDSREQNSNSTEEPTNSAVTGASATLEQPAAETNATTNSKLAEEVKSVEATEIEKPEVNAETVESISDAEENATTEKTKAQKKEERAQAKEDIRKHEELVKAQRTEAEGLKGNARKNVMENGASAEFADVDDAALKEKIDTAKAKGASADEINKLTSEQQRRADFKASAQNAQTGKTTLKNYREQKFNKIEKVIDTIGKTTSASSSIMSLFASDENTGTDKKVKHKGYYDPKYLRAGRYLATVASNDSYFGGGHNDDQKRRFKKFAKRI